MRCVVHLEPLGRRDLVGADDGTDLVVQDLGRSARQRPEPEIAEPREVLAEPEPERRRALPHLERRERVHVDPGHGGPDRRDDVGVVVAGERRMDAALQADLRRAPVPGLDARAC